jgi:uncharacterized membrane protein required for colicin V production
MWLNLVFFGLLAVFVALGAWKGALATGLGLATLLLSYAAAWTLGPGLAPALAEQTGLAPLWALPAAGCGVFVASYVVLGTLSALARRVFGGRAATRGPRDRFLGGCFGGVRGLLVALLVSYLALWVDALRVTGGAPWMPEVGDSAAARFTAEVVESGIEASLGDSDPAARVAARVAARPAVAAVEVERVLENPNVESLRSDSMFWTYVEHGSIDTALNRGSFQRLSRDAELRARLGALGLIEPAAVDDDAAFRAAVAEVLREVGPRIRGLKNDPELHALLDDAQVVAMLESGDAFGLLAHPGFRGLVDRVTSRPSPD